MRYAMNDDRLVHLIASAPYNPRGWQRLSADERFNAYEDARYLIGLLERAGYVITPKREEVCSEPVYATI
jgi:hypothetical protein